MFDRVDAVRPGDPAFNDVVRVRRSGYGARLEEAGPLPAHVMSDGYDQHALVLLVYREGRAVGTVRLCLQPECRPFDYSVYRDHARAWPGLSSVITMSRLAVVAELHGQGLLRPLQALAAEAAIKAGRDFVVAGAACRALPSYEKLGWRRTGVRYASHLGPRSEFMTLAAGTRGR